jgi:tetratricopeptide (TPR) repeat protein
VGHLVIATLLQAGLIPLSLLVTLLLIRAISYLWYVVLNRRALPIVINDITGKSPLPESWQDLPSLLRDYVAADPSLSRQLAPGVTGSVSPDIPSAVPSGSPGSWTATLVSLVFPQRHAAYNIFITPHASAGNRLAGSVQVVKAPEQWIVSAKTVATGTIQELVFQIGGFCLESVQLQPGFLRRTPRWEHWGSHGGYGLFRHAVQHQEAGEYDRAHLLYDQASAAAPGNIRLGAYRASLYELEGKFLEAMRLYDALHCLWRKNIEISYRSAAARVNLVLKLLDELKVTPESLGILVQGTPNIPSARPGHAQRVLAQLQEAERRLSEAQEIFDLTERDLSYPRLLARCLSTRLPRRRDLGEFRYWTSWLRRDHFRQPLVLLRRSKGYEYRKAVQVARHGNRLLALLLRLLVTSCDPQLAAPERAARCARQLASFDMDQSVAAVLGLVRKKRAGWLAHWTAACYFSRAALAEKVIAPADWQGIERRWRDSGSLGFLRTADTATTWGDCCGEIAIGEIGRALRNPCNQLNTELLQTDPDMKRLHKALKGMMVRVLIGPIPPAAARVPRRRQQPENPEVQLSDAMVQQSRREPAPPQPQPQAQPQRQPDHDDR